MRSRPAPGRRAPRAAAACALLAALAAPARAEVEPRALPVVERYLAATGGREARVAETTQHYKGRIEAAGLRGRWELWVAQPDRWVRTTTLGSLHLREGFDGSVAWRTDLGARSVQLLDAAQVKRSREEGWFLNERWALPGEDGGTIRAGNTSYKGEDVYDAIVIVPPVGSPRKMLVNAKTGFVERVTHESDQYTVEDRPSEYRLLAGRKRPSVYAAPTLLPSDKPVERMTVDSAWVNVPADSALFSPPVLEQRAIAWQRGGGEVRVPFVYSGKSVYVKVSINGAAPAEFMLDTGASLTVLDEDYARSLGLAAEGESSVQGIAAGGEMRFSKVASIALGGAGSAGATLRDFRVARVDLGKSSEILHWRKSVGLLGADFLGRFVVTLDYDSCLVTLRDPASFRYEGGGEALPFELHQGIPVVEMTLDDGCTGKFLVDVGNSFQFVVHGSLVRSCEMIRAKRRKEIEVYGGGIGGGFVATMCRIDSLRIGRFSWPDPVAVLALHTRGIIGSQDYAGNIGNTVLERFRCTFDYSRRTLWLEPGRRFANRERVSRFGALFARFHTRVVAGNILSGSAAQEAGLRWYDEIVAIDGRPIEQWSREEVDRVLEQGEVGSVHRVAYRRFDFEPVKVVEVTLRDVL